MFSIQDEGKTGTGVYATGNNLSSLQDEGKTESDTYATGNNVCIVANKGGTRKIDKYQMGKNLLNIEDKRKTEKWMRTRQATFVSIRSTCKRHLCKVNTLWHRLKRKTC